MGWMVGIQFLGEAGNFSPHQHIQTGSEAHPSLLSNVMWVLSPGVKWSGHEVDHSPLLVLRLRMHRAIPPLTQYIFIAQCLIKHRIRLQGVVLS